MASTDDLLLEASTKFDIYYNNIMSDMAPGLNSYEKSVFLTDAQDNIILELYSGRNSTGLSFEETEELRRYLSKFVHRKEIKLEGTSTTNEIPVSSIYTEESNVLAILYEEADAAESKCHQSSGNLLIVPTTWDEYWKTSKNPFRKANSRRVLRLDSDDKIILKSSKPLGTYKVTYLQKPAPIILENLTSYDLSIRGETQPSIGALENSTLFNMIVNRAALLAKLSWSSGQETATK